MRRRDVHHTLRIVLAVLLMLVFFVGRFVHAQDTAWIAANIDR